MQKNISSQPFPYLLFIESLYQPGFKISLIGHAFNKILQKNIPVYISESGPGFRRLTEIMGRDVKDAALVKVKERFENGTLFKDDDLKQMEQLTITNMLHPSDGDSNNHYSVQGETITGVKVKGGHVPEDTSKQTVGLLLRRFIWE